ncbi:hypothetical protein KP509_26G026000 [Ceratopteris richardii]|nr:hypothetical protein KP509_26G026000 [Ceratopteris richardii]
MSCNGCRVLRKGCSDTCVLRSCLQWIESPEAQGHATVFVAKFFGRAGMLSFINAVSESERPALFQSLLYEACGRTVNPVFGAVGLLRSGNWALCQEAVDTVLKGGVLKPSSSCPPPSKMMQAIAPRQKSSSTKRSQPLAEGDLNLNANVKRLRCTDPCEDQQPEAGCSDGALTLNHVLPSFPPHLDTNIIRSPAFPCFKSEQKPFSCGKLVAPVARRVHPQLHQGLGMKFMEFDHQQASKGEGMQVQDSIRLDLSLNLSGNEAVRLTEVQNLTRSRSDIQQKIMEGTIDNTTLDVASLANSSNPHVLSLDGTPGASSPCHSFSMNSEGSVTSLDTVDFSAPCASHEECQLLHLL